MKIIFEDGNDREETENISSGHFEFEDVSSVSSDENKAKRPVRPVRRPAPTLRPAPAKEEKEPEAPVQPPQAQQAYAQMPYVQYPQGYPVYPPQGYMTPEQAAAFGQQYPQGYPVYPPVQGGYMQPQFVPYQQPVQNQPSAGTENGSGMRVLYQSPDFDRQERKNDSTVYSRSGIQTGIVHEDVDFADETVSDGKLKKAEAKRPVSRVTRSFNEDDLEMSLFELNAMGNSYQPTVKTVRQPKSKDHPFDVEELEDGSEEEYPEEDEALESVDGEEKKKLPVSEIIRRVVLSVAIVAIVVSVAMLLNEWRLSKENDDLVEDVSGLIIDVEEVTTTTKSSKDDEEKTTKKDEKEEDKTTTVAELTPAQQWAQIQADYPDVIFPANLQLKYAKLYATNQDFVGYLTADGVNLNLPIVQAEDDEEYMDKNFYGKTTKYGCPFVTHLNNITELDTNTVIFGHHMNNGTLFGALDAYKTIDGFKAAPVITFNTLYKDYQWKVIAAFITNAYEREDNGYVFRYYFTSLSTEERYSAFLNELSQRTLYDTGVDVLPTDKILTLSTCSHEFNEARFVVVARLVRNGETAEVDVSKAAVNPNPRYPQAYYDKKGIENPFEDASRWEVG